MEPPNRDAQQAKEGNKMRSQVMCNEGSWDNVWLERTLCEVIARTLEGMEGEGTGKSAVVEHIQCIRYCMSQCNHYNSLR